MSYEETDKLYNSFFSAFRKAGIAQSLFHSLKQDLIRSGGYYDHTATYAGPGEVGDLFVPDLEFGKAAFIHDACYSYIRSCIKGGFTPLINKSEADKIFYYCMMSTRGKFPFKKLRVKLYYLAVVKLGAI